MARHWWERGGLRAKAAAGTPAGVDSSDDGGPRQVPEGEAVARVTGTPATPGEERLARLALAAIDGRSDAHLFVNWSGSLLGGHRTQLDLVVLCDRSVTVVEHLERPTAEMVRLGGGDADWVCTYPGGRAFTASNPLDRNEAFLAFVRDRYPGLERLSLAVLDDRCPTDTELPIDVRRPDGTRRMVVRERSVPWLLRDLVGRNSTPEQSATSVALQHFLKHAG